MAVEMKTPLRLLREMLTQPKVSQETMARLTGISLLWYRLLESGQQQNTSWTTANALLRAVNAERANRGMELVALDQLGLTIV